MREHTIFDLKITETLVLGDYRDQSVAMGASGRGDVKRRPRTEGSGSHMATEVTRRMAGQGLMRMTRSQELNRQCIGSTWG